MGSAATSHLIEHAQSAHIYKSLETVEGFAATVQSIVDTPPMVQFALVTITLCFETEGKMQANSYVSTERSVDYYLTNLRPLVRKTDMVVLVEHTCYFLLLGADLEGGKTVQIRLRDALFWQVHNVSDDEALQPRYVSIGHSAYPFPSKDISSCILAASDACLSFEMEKTPSDTSKRAEYEMQETELPALARKLGVPYLLLIPQLSPAKVKLLVNPKLAQELHCYPLGRERGTLTVAMSNPCDSSALARLRRETGLHIFPVLTHPQTLQVALDQLI
ncbi:MAG: hypothetical protein JO202_03520 [Ktedonobacteraceae bacterium]|nr:hypothetical protein [Ktedonobacteraceae bacterium]